MKKRVPARREALAATAAKPTNSPRTRGKAVQRGKALDAMAAAKVFTDEPMTLEKASSNRVTLARAGSQRALSEGVASGSEWYFEHHAKLAAVAHDTGIHKDRVIAASASMSPQNSPDQEYAAVHALAHAHSDSRASVTVRPGAAAALNNPDLAEYEGKSMHPSRFTPETLASLSEPGARAHVDTQGLDLEEVSKGGVKSQVAKAIGVLRGDIAPESAINPRTSPKVWSYHQNIREAVPGSPEHMEFKARMHNVTTQIPGQQRLDITGMKDTTTGILSPTGPSAEDSWMHAISTGQPLAAVKVPGRTGRASTQSPAKFVVGEGGGVNEKALSNRITRRDKAGNEISHRPIVKGATTSGLEHAWSNKATIMAAETMGAPHGEHMPVVGMQTLAWHEGRRQAGRDADYEAMRRGGDEPRQRAVADSPQMFKAGKGGAEKVRGEARPPQEYREAKRPKQIPGQQSMFG